MLVVRLVQYVCAIVPPMGIRYIRRRGEVYRLTVVVAAVGEEGPGEHDREGHVRRGYSVNSARESMLLSKNSSLTIGVPSIFSRLGVKQEDGELQEDAASCPEG